MIKQATIERFSAYELLSLKFSPNLNVIIGENGTGKTQLLKTLYSSCPFGMTAYNNDSDIEMKNFEFTERLLQIFQPLDRKLGKLHTTGTTGQSTVNVVFDNDQEFTFTLNTNSKQTQISKQCKKECCAAPIFIPTKEVISFMEGFQSLYESHKISFDKTYHSLVVALEYPEKRELPNKSKWAIEEIEKICGGKFIFYGGGKVTFKTAGDEYSANMTAEGFRKIGILARLLLTGAIEPGVTGPLFWDEPECNMNPRLLKTLVQILIEFSRLGQQIFISTHDYTLLKWISLLSDEKMGDHVLYHAFYRDHESHKLEYFVTNRFNKITPNVLLDTFSDLMDVELSKTMGDLGK